MVRSIQNGMRRADRLLQIIQILRRANGPIAAGRIAEELEVSLRTLYRDMASLESTGVPVRGEAGIGYVLEEGYDMPPLMFTAAELEAVMLGARLLDGRVDEALSRAAKDAVAKIAAVIPSDLRATLIDTPLLAPQFGAPDRLTVNMEKVRQILRSENQAIIRYRAINGEETERKVFAIAIALFSEATVLVAWCTMREDYRVFRLDGITDLKVLEDKFPIPRKTLYMRWKRTKDEELRTMRGETGYN